MSFDVYLAAARYTELKPGAYWKDYNQNQGWYKIKPGKCYLQKTDYCNGTAQNGAFFFAQNSAGTFQWGSNHPPGVGDYGDGQGSQHAAMCVAVNTNDFATIYSFAAPKGATWDYSCPNDVNIKRVIGLTEPSSESYYGPTPPCPYGKRYDLTATNASIIQPITIMFINGANVRAQKVFQQTSALKTYLSTYLTDRGVTGDIKYTYGYQNSANALADFYQAMKQARCQDYAECGDGTPDNPVSIYGYTYGYRSYGTNSELVIGQYNADQNIWLNDKDYQKIMSRVRADIADKRIIILVAHSQGNLYANKIADSLSDSERSRVGIMNIGTPTVKAGGISGRYYTGVNDVITNLARRRFPAILPGNTANSNTYIASFEDAPFHHGIIETYLSGDVNQERILSGILSLIKQTVPSPIKSSKKSNIAGSGVYAADVPDLPSAIK